MFVVGVEGVEPLAERMRRYPEKMRLFIGNNLATLGRRIAYLMREELKPVRYTGQTEDSVTSQVDIGSKSVSIFPQTPQALWIRTGTRPHWAPIEPLQRWSAQKLGSEKIAWAIQGGIAAHGTSMWALQKYGTKENAYPERTLERGDTQVAIINTARRLGEDMAAWIGGEV